MVDVYMDRGAGIMDAASANNYYSYFLATNVDLMETIVGTMLPMTDYNYYCSVAAMAESIFQLKYFCDERAVEHIYRC